ncbi:MAG: hypothetical protein II723_05310 [Oscillospiraceae bacterium]|nr:hypothetical protein [Oscillospiraceae bacterium]
MSETNIREFSLLEPAGTHPAFVLSSTAANDLSVSFLAEHLAHSRTEIEPLRKILLRMPVSEAVIRYRREIYAELRGDSELRRQLYEIFDSMRFYVTDRPVMVGESPSILELFTFFRSTQYYIGCILKLRDAIEGRSFRAEGLRRFADCLKVIYTDSGFEELSKDIEALGEDAGRIHSLTIGVNLDQDFRPHVSGILSMNRYFFGEQGLLKNFAAFHRKDQISDENDHPVDMAVHRDGLDWIERHFPNWAGVGRPGDSTLMNNLNSIIERMLPALTGKLKKFLDKYVDVSGKALGRLADEMLFYQRFIELEERLTASGLPCCDAVCSETATELRDFYNLKLAICRAEETVGEEIVCNDAVFTKAHTVWILTGPNRGGKTILTQGLGLAFLLFQSGVFVPASAAQMRPCSGIYTHFPVEEERTVSLGRLGEEAERFREICKAADSDSLLLFNESFATTSHTESLYIAEDVLKYLCCLGARTCFNTHMHELAEHAAQFGKTDGAVCGAVSVVMESENGKRAYKISFRQPDGKSYAHEIACQYGITFEQLRQQQRGKDSDSA